MYRGDRHARDHLDGGRAGVQLHPLLEQHDIVHVAVVAANGVGDVPAVGERDGAAHAADVALRLAARAVARVQQHARLATPEAAKVIYA